MRMNIFEKFPKIFKHQSKHFYISQSLDWFSELQKMNLKQQKQHHSKIIKTDPWILIGIASKPISFSDSQFTYHISVKDLINILLSCVYFLYFLNLKETNYSGLVSSY